MTKIQAFGVLMGYFVLASAAAGAAIQGPQTLFQGGVLSQDQKTLYLISPENRAQRIHLLSGRPIWKTLDGTLPLFENQDTLITLSLDSEKPNGFRAVGLSKKSGKVTFQSALMELPSWAGVSLNLDSLPGKSTDLEALPSGQELLINWTARSFYWGGAPPPHCVLVRANRSGHGTFKVQMTTGKTQNAVFVEDPIPPCDDDQAPFPGRRHFENPIGSAAVSADPEADEDKAGQILFEAKWQEWIFRGILKLRSETILSSLLNLARGSAPRGLPPGTERRAWWNGSAVDLKAYQADAGAKIRKAKWSIPFTFYRPLIPPP